VRAVVRRRRSKGRRRQGSKHTDRKREDKSKKKETPPKGVHNAARSLAWGSRSLEHPGRNEFIEVFRMEGDGQGTTAFRNRTVRKNDLPGR